MHANPSHLQQYLEENLAAQDVQLSPAEIQTVRDAINRAGLMNASARYSPQGMAQLFVDSPPLKK
jgi:hypothetical protein